MFLQVDHLGFGDIPHALVDGFYYLLVVDFASEPFEVDFLVLFLDCQLYLPERFRDKLLNLFGLIDTKAQCRCLARTISNRNLGIAAPTAECLLKRSRLKAGKGHAYLQIKHLTGIH